MLSLEKEKDKNRQLMTGLDNDKNGELSIDDNDDNLDELGK